MNTTKIAKWLVVLNTGMAIAFLMWAVAIYTQRIDWFTAAEASGGEPVVGQIEKMQEQIKILAEAHNKAYTFWAINKAQVDEQEKDYPLRRDFERNQILMTKLGTLNGQPVDQPFQKFVDRADGLMTIDKPTGRDAIVYRGNEPLRDLKKYDGLIAGTTATIKSTKEDIGKLVLELKSENDRIYDSEGNGLRKLIKEQEDILNAARLEREYLGTSNANLLAETTLFTKRREALKARLKELESVPTSTGR